jgi:quinol monooxygenase YgiN
VTAGRRPFEENVMSKSATFVRHKAKPGKRDDIRRIWEKYARGYIAGSNGSLSYYYCYDDNDPDTIIVFQLAADQTSAQEFVKQPWFGDYQRETAALLAGQSELRTATPQWVKDPDA